MLHFIIYILLMLSQPKETLLLCSYKICPNRMFEHTLRSSSLMSNQRECLPVLGAWEIMDSNTSLSFELQEDFYSVWSPVTSILRWSFDFHSHDGYTYGGITIITLQATDRDCWSGDLVAHQSPHSASGVVQSVVGRLK